MIRNILMLKLVRIARIGSNFIPEKVVVDLIMSLYEPESRDMKIAKMR